jgi:hypothetical protein
MSGICGPLGVIEHLYGLLKLQLWVNKARLQPGKRNRRPPDGSKIIIILRYFNIFSLFVLCFVNVETGQDRYHGEPDLYTDSQLHQVARSNEKLRKKCQRPGNYSEAIECRSGILSLDLFLEPALTVELAMCCPTHILQWCIHSVRMWAKSWERYSHLFPPPYTKVSSSFS